MERCRIAFLDSLFGNLTILVDFLGPNLVEGGHDGDEDILWVVFFEVFVASSSCFTMHRWFKVRVLTLR